MCRITGFWDLYFKGAYNIVDTISSMRDTLSHGGPDDAGLYVEKDKGIALGHRRLSIIDISRLGHQPMSDDEGNLWITYNGEVYNFKEIREELISKGYTFKSNSDTEVVIKAYKQWGVDAVHKYRGMFAFAIWDKKKESLTLCRDRVGVKPLYWYYKDGLFMFSSELKSFHEHPNFSREINEEALSIYLQLGYIPAPHSIFKYAHKMNPGHFLFFSKTEGIKEIQYWDVKDYFIKGYNQNRKYLAIKNEEEIEYELEQILIDSFQLRLVSDVPVGILLSGGIDSSIVTALLCLQGGQQLKTFTIGFPCDKSYDEAPYAKKIANILKTNHTEYYFTEQEIKEVIPTIAFLYDEPFGDSSALPTYLVSSIAKNDVKVVLSADGGDELFCGYNHYFGTSAKTLNGLVELLKIDRFRKTIYNLMETADFKKNLTVPYPTENNIRGKLNKFKNFLEKIDLKIGWDTRTALMYLDFIKYLPDDILTKIDRASMGVSLEGREPFLDHKIIEYVCQLPIKYKYRNGVNKYILRKILYKYIPKELLERPKQGFSIPLDNQYYKPCIVELCNEYLSERMLKRIGIIDYKIAGKLLNRFIDNKITYDRIWYILCLQIWAERYL